MHAFIGTLIFVGTTVAAALAWNSGNGMSFRKISSSLENLATFAAWFISLSGIGSLFYRRFGRYEWKSGAMLFAIKLHKIFGRVYCFLIQGLIFYAIIENFGR